MGIVWFLDGTCSVDVVRDGSNYVVSGEEAGRLCIELGERGYPVSYNSDDMFRIPVSALEGDKEFAGAFARATQPKGKGHTR